ncbi:hypothetical protein GOP47_0002384 [Adiantum capillus-veneris]|uniref:Uncharacterized protein n=1 Tax=Adiantum capillus-veneris TaxID=13818 RepID=A0A9D4VBH1_ADICA|nr:hypothetical protein GOP47_0002384 [Adiantum capillus-veneris]
MAASSEEVIVTWGGLSEDEGLRARLQAMAMALQKKDAALQDLQRRLQAALGEVEQGRAKEDALRRRAEIAEAAEEALASQMAQLEAEAYASITQSNRVQKDAVQVAKETWKGSGEEPMGARQRIEELERWLEAAREEAAGWERRYREVALPERAKAPIELCHVNPLADGDVVRRADSHVAELQRRLAEVERELEAIHAKLQEAEQKVGGHTQQAVRKGETEPSEAVVVSMPLKEVAGMLKLRLWSAASLILSST